MFLSFELRAHLCREFNLKRFHGKKRAVDILRLCTENVDVTRDRPHTHSCCTALRQIMPQLLPLAAAAAAASAAAASHTERVTCQDRFS